MFSEQCSVFVQIRSLDIKSVGPETVRVDTTWQVRRFIITSGKVMLTTSPKWRSKSARPPAFTWVERVHPFLMLLTFMSRFCLWDAQVSSQDLGLGLRLLLSMVQAGERTVWGRAGKLYLSTCNSLLLSLECNCCLSIQAYNWFNTCCIWSTLWVCCLKC